MTLGVEGWGSYLSWNLNPKQIWLLDSGALRGRSCKLMGGSFIPDSCGHLTLASPISVAAVQGVPSALFASMLGTHRWLC